jgi:hypothetical protein
MLVRRPHSTLTLFESSQEFAAARATPFSKFVVSFGLPAGLWIAKLFTGERACPAMEVCMKLPRVGRVVCLVEGDYRLGYFRPARSKVAGATKFPVASHPRKSDRVKSRRCHHWW